MNYLPKSVANFLENRGQSVIEIKNLKGQSANVVLKLVLKNEASLILKECKNEQEIFFYKHYSMQFNQLGIAVPKLMHADANYILIEYVKPIKSWTDKHLRAQMQYLKRLHFFAAPVPQLKLKRYDWKKEDTKNLLSFFDSSTYFKIEDLINSYEAHSVDLFEGDTLISGDTNITNWGEKNGRLVLFDWERIGIGNPLLDLAIAIPGFPKRREIENYLFLYNNKSLNTTGKWKYKNDVKLIQTGIVWNVVSFLSSVYKQECKPFKETLFYICEKFPGWLIENKVD